MANPYSIPAKFTYTPLPLEKLAQVYSSKQEKYDDAGNKVNELLSKIEFPAGLLTEQEAIRQQKDYQERVKVIAENLRTSKNPTTASREVSEVLNHMANNKVLKDIATDAAIKPELIKSRATTGEDGFYAWINPATGQPYEYGKDIASTGRNITEYYGFQAPGDFKFEIDYAHHLEPDARESLGSISMESAPNGEQFFTRAGSSERFKSWTDALGATSPEMMAYIKSNFDDSSTPTAQFYKRKFGEEAGLNKYIENTLSKLNPIQYNQVQKNAQNLGQYYPNRGKGKNTGQGDDDEQLNPNYTVTTGSPGVEPLIGLDKDNPFAIKELRKQKQEELDVKIQTGASEDEKIALRDELAKLELTEAETTKAERDYWRENPNKIEEIRKATGWSKEEFDYWNNGNQWDISGVQEINQLRSEGIDKLVNTRLAPGTSIEFAKKIERYKYLSELEEVANDAYSSVVGESQKDFINDRLQNAQVQEIKRYSINFGEGVSAEYSKSLSLKARNMIDLGAYTTKGTQVLTADNDGEYDIIDLNDNQLKQALTTAFNSNLIDNSSISVEFAPDGAYMTFSTSEGINKDGLFEGQTAGQTIERGNTRFRVKIQDQASEEGWDDQTPSPTYTFFKTFEQIQMTDQNSSIKTSNFYGKGWLDYSREHINPIRGGGQNYNMKSDLQKQASIRGGLKSEIAANNFISTSAVYQGESSTSLGYTVKLGADKNNAKTITTGEVFSQAANSSMGTKAVSKTSTLPEDQTVIGLVLSVANSYIQGGKNEAEREARGKEMDNYFMGKQTISYSDMAGYVSAKDSELLNKPFVFDNQDQLSAYLFNGKK